MKVNVPRILLASLLIVFQACDHDPSPQVPAGSAGYFVVNEGGFGNSNTSISFYDRAANTMTNDVFAKKNGRALGDQTESITVFEGKAYVVVQHSAKIEVINADDYSSLNTISDNIESPRYLLPISSTKAYVSDWGDGFSGSVKVIDLGNMTVTKSITTGKGPNEMVLKDGKVYVANSGGFDNDNTISVIDISSDAVTSTINVGDNPNSLRFDKDGNLWVLGAGKFAYNEDYSVDVANSTKSTISKVVNGTETTRLSIDDIAYPGAAHLNINKGGDKLFYIFDGAVYSLANNASTAPATSLIGDKYYYGLAVDPITDEIIACEAPDFSSPGAVYTYSPAGALVRSFQVGIAPNGVGFK
jgi:YVTN family beta-propeller protein